MKNYLDMGDYFKDVEESQRRELRDGFARAALTGMLSVVRVNLTQADIDEISSSSYLFADAMLKARKVK